MNNFEYLRASDVADAVRKITAEPAAKFIAGGTNLIDLMKYDVERPMRLIDITHLPLNNVEETANGGLRIGATRAEQRSRLPPVGRETLSVVVECDPGRGLAATTQHGVDRW